MWILARTLSEKKGYFQDRMTSQSISIEGVAGLRIAGLESKLEPAHALGRGPMSKSVWNHVTLVLRWMRSSPIWLAASTLPRYLRLQDLAALVGLTGPDS